MCAAIVGCGLSQSQGGKLLLQRGTAEGAPLTRVQPLVVGLFHGTVVLSVESSRPCAGGASAKQTARLPDRNEHRLRHLFNLPLEEQREPSLIVLVQSSLQFEALAAEVNNLLQHLLIEAAAHPKEPFVPLQGQNLLLELRICDNPLHW